MKDSEDFAAQSAPNREQRHAPFDGVLADARWTAHNTGIGRFAREVLGRLPGCRHIKDGLRVLHPFEPLWLWHRIGSASCRVYFSPGFNVPLRSPAPFVPTIHDLIHLKVPDESSLLKRTYYERLLRPALNHASAVLTVSEYSRSEIIDWVGPQLMHRIHVVGAGVSAEFTPHGPRFDPGHPYLLYVGNARPHKNLLSTLEAFGRARIDRGIVLLCICPEDRMLRAAASAPGIKNRVQFTGLVSDSDLAALYRGALALLHATQYEGFGLPAVEALACGTPVVAGNTTATPEVLGDAALYVDPNRIDSILHGIETLVEDETLRERLRLHGTTVAANHRWDGVAGRVGNVLQNLAG